MFHQGWACYRCYFYQLGKVEAQQSSLVAIHSAAGLAGHSTPQFFSYLALSVTYPSTWMQYLFSLAPPSPNLHSDSWVEKEPQHSQAGRKC